MAHAPSTFVVIPTYNEADNLPALVAELLAQPVDNPSTGSGRRLQIVIVDDSSPDGTGEIAEELSQRYAEHLNVIHRPDKQGLGSAYRDGFRYALAQGADFIVQMDADFSHSPAYIPQFLRHTAAHEVIVGSRYVDGGRIDPGWERERYVLSWWANTVYTRLILGLRVRDATAGFKCWSRPALEAVLAYGVRSNGYVFQVEMAYLAEKLGFRVLEIPIYFEDRRIGRSKMSMKVKLEAVWRTWYLRWQYRDVRPAPSLEDGEWRVESGKWKVESIFRLPSSVFRLPSSIFRSISRTLLS